MLREARTEYRKNAAEQDAAKIDALVKKADSKLSFLKMITPRRAVTTGNGGRYVVFEGEIVEGASAKRKSGFKDTRPDPDDIARHERLLKFVQLLNLFVFFFIVWATSQFATGTPH
jgi:hypothetical protein